MSEHIEWLNLIDRSGPFMEPEVLDAALPQGLERVDSERRRTLLSAYDEWREAVDQSDASLEGLHREWIHLVLNGFLEFEARLLLEGESVPAGLTVSVVEHNVSIRPRMALMKGEEPKLLIDVLAPDEDLEAVKSRDRWSVSALDRMVALCRGAKVPLGLVTNGERWLVVHATEGGTVGHASWYGRIWRPEPVTLRAFQTLLGIRRCFGPQEKTLGTLLEESLKHQDEVTATLGQQVRRAVEVLIQSLDRADHDRQGSLLHDVEPRELYEAGLTVMMRLVFLLCAEERGLLLLGEGLYDQNYAISTLRAELRESQSRFGNEVLERRHDAWSRLLATFRAVYGGVSHETLRMPALGGSLFDPDRFPFLEGRAKGSSWRKVAATPLPIDNRTVLLLLSSLQVLEHSRGARLLSYKALDVEQIGHVYEGLLEYSVYRLPRVTLGLVGSSDAENPNISLEDLELASKKGETALLVVLNGITGRSESALRRALGRDLDEAIASRLLIACGSDPAMLQRVKLFANLLRTDIWGDPLIYRQGAFAVVLGSDRQETGTHYTPKALTEKIVKETIEPIVFFGPTEGASRQDWRLKSPREILELKVCDPAMGSGAFLVQACRYLAERLVEAWEIAEQGGQFVTVDGQVLESADGHEPLQKGMDERLVTARLLIAERCLYGVDLNPMAVELAKLSLWLVTLAKGRPFGFLDHNLRCGNSLLGIHRTDQLTELTLNPNKISQPRLFGQSIRGALEEVGQLRDSIRNTTIRDIHDIEIMQNLDQKARARLEIANIIANAFIGIIYASNGHREQTSRLSDFSIKIDQAISGEGEIIELIKNEMNIDFKCNISEYDKINPFHWSLNFPEVFNLGNGGFDVILSNPPWGADMPQNLVKLWKLSYDNELGRLVDSFHLFILRSIDLLSDKRKSILGLVVPDVILNQGYSESLRKFLLSEMHVMIVCSLHNNVFSKVTRPSCYFIANNYRTAESAVNISSWPTDSEQNNQQENIILQNWLSNFPGYIIPTHNIEEYFEAARFSSNIKYTISDIVDSNGIQRGASADNKDVFVVSRELAKELNLEENFLHPVITGGIHLNMYKIATELPLLIYTRRDDSPQDIPNIYKWINENIHKITCKEAAAGKHPIHALHRPRDRFIFEAHQKIIGVITSDKPKVAVDENQLYSLDGTYVLSLKEGIDPYYVAAVLNSKLMAKIYRAFSQEEGKVMAQVKPTIIGKLPIINPLHVSNEMLEKIKKISVLSKKLHDTSVDENTKSDLMLEVDSIVNDVYALASI